MFTELHYMYRDASNYKEGKYVYFEGAATQEQRTAIGQKLESGLYFIPADIELEELQPRMTSFPSEDDHVWHEFVDLTLVEALPCDAIVVGPIDQLAQAFDRISGPTGWDVEGAVIRLGV